MQYCASCAPAPAASGPAECFDVSGSVGTTSMRLNPSAAKLALCCGSVFQHSCGRGSSGSDQMYGRSCWNDCISHSLIRDRMSAPIGMNALQNMARNMGLILHDYPSPPWPIGMARRRAEMCAGSHRGNPEPHGCVPASPIKSGVIDPRALHRHLGELVAAQNRDGTSLQADESMLGPRA